MLKNPRSVLVGLLVLAVAASALLVYESRAAGAAPVRGSSPGTLVTDWNQELVRIVNTPNAQPATVHATRGFAILQAAVYDAVVATTHAGAPYRVSAVAAPGARADAAAAAAAHDTLAALYPAFATELDQQLNSELAGIPDSAGKQAGIAAGRLTAHAWLGIRTGDGSAAVPAPGPVFTHWAQVAPFVLHRADQYRSPAPDLAGVEFRQALTEVFQFGEDSSRFRTADQTQTARFWPGPIWVTWNQIADRALAAHHADLLTSARLLAELDLAFADTVIAFYDAKYAYRVARPVAMIRTVESQAQWTPLLATPNDPSYPGAHSAISAAGATVLAGFFGDRDRLAVTSDSLPGATRNFDSYSAAAAEAGLSRIYGGVHTRADHDAGVVLGHQVAAAVISSAGAGWV